MATTKITTIPAVTEKRIVMKPVEETVLVRPEEKRIDVSMTMTEIAYLLAILGHRTKAFDGEYDALGGDLYAALTGPFFTLRGDGEDDHPLSEGFRNREYHRAMALRTAMLSDKTLCEP